MERLTKAETKLLKAARGKSSTNWNSKLRAFTWIISSVLAFTIYSLIVGTLRAHEDYHGSWINSINRGASPAFGALVFWLIMLVAGRTQLITCSLLSKLNVTENEIQAPATGA